MKLKPEMAQQIADQTSRIISYNVNIMDGEGYIVGSNDASRIGSFHDCAYNVIRTGISMEMTDEEAKEMNSQKDGVIFSGGINLPVRFNHEVIGVVGIKGEPEEIRKFGLLVRMVVETMIQERYVEEQAELELESKVDFLKRMLDNENDLDDENTITRGEILGFDLTVPRTVVIINLNYFYAYILENKRMNLENRSVITMIKQVVSDSYEDIVFFSEEEKVILLKDMSGANAKGDSRDVLLGKLDKLAGQIQDKYNIFVNIGIGSRSDELEGLRRSYFEAGKALSIGKKVYNNRRIYQFEDIEAGYLVSRIPQKDRLKYLQKLSLDETLLETLEVLLENNLSVSKTAEKLFIHRNTVLYRVKKIESVTGYSISVFDQAFELKMLVMLSKL